MRIVLFCEQKYAINILTPIQEEALKAEDTTFYGMSIPGISLTFP